MTIDETLFPHISYEYLQTTVPRQVTYVNSNALSMMTDSTRLGQESVPETCESVMISLTVVMDDRRYLVLSSTAR